MPHYVFRLHPPRPSFAQDLSAEEAGVMRAHAEYWSRLTAQGRVLIFGPVDDPAGVWGIGILEAADDDTARALAEADPAVRSGTCRGEMLRMLSAHLAA
jgi:uncharacterized protein YciI